MKGSGLMMTSFSYYYRKSSLIPQVLLGLLFNAFIIFWMRAAVVITDRGVEVGGSFGERFANMRMMFTVIPVFMLAVGIYITLSPLIKILLPSAVIAGDEQGLTVRGAWLKKHHFTWSELSYIRYEQRTNLYRNQHSGSMRSYLQELLMIKPQTGRTVSVGLHQLDGTVDDIVADIRKVAPNLEIKGFEG